MLHAKFDRFWVAPKRLSALLRACSPPPTGITCVDRAYHRSGLREAIHDVRRELEKAQGTVVGTCHSRIEQIQEMLRRMDRLMFKYHNDVQALDRPAMHADEMAAHRWEARWSTMSPQVEAACD